MSRRLQKVSTGLAALALVAVGGCGGSDDGAQSDLSDSEVQQLSDQALAVAAALDIVSTPPGSYFPPRELTTDVLEQVGVQLADGATVVEYQRATKADGGRFRELPYPDDYWQFCLVDADGRWVTYGDASGAQAFGSGGETECSFPGTPSDEAPADLRLVAQEVADVTGGEAFVESADQAPDDAGRIREMFADELPEEFVLSPVDLAGVRYQLCVTTPTAGWFLVQVDSVMAYGDPSTAGRCEINPDMKPEF